MDRIGEDMTRIGYVVLVGVVLGSALWPWATATLVPSTDFPSHLALVEVMHGLSEAGSAIARKFTWGFFPAPNSMFYLLTYVLSFVFGTLLAGRILFVAGMVLQVIAFGYFANTFGRSRWVIFAAIPLVAQWTLTEGFLDYYIGVGFLFIAIAAQHRYLSQPTQGRGIAAGLLGVCVFLSHVQAFLFYGLWSVLLLMLHAVRDRYFVSTENAWPQALKKIATVLLPCGLFAVAWIVMAKSSVGQSTWSSGIRVIFEPQEKRIFHLFRHSIMAFSSGHGILVAAVILGVLLMRTMMVWGKGPTREDWLQDSFLALALVLLFVIFFVAPLNIGLYWNLYNRSVLPIWLLAVCMILPRGRLRSDIWGMVAILPMVVVISIGSQTWKKSLKVWEQYSQGFTEVISAAPKQTHLFYVVENRNRVGMRSTLWRHLAQYHTVLNRGTTSYSFGIQPGRLVRERNPLPYEQNKEFGRIRDMTHLEKYGCFDIVLQAGHTRAERRFPGRFRVIKRRGQWTLYQVTKWFGKCRHKLST